MVVVIMTDFYIQKYDIWFSLAIIVDMAKITVVFMRSTQ